MMNFSFVLTFFYAILAAAQTFNNPVLWEDLADLDIIRVDSTYYYSSSTMHYSPGAPVLRSYDLVNWEYIGHSVPTLDFGSQYNLGGQQAYVNGIWASSFKYRKSNNKWYWIGCIEFSKTYIYTASSPSGPWTKSATLNQCYYDVGLFIDDNDTMYVAYGNTQISVAQLSSDGLSQVKSQQVFDAKSLGVTLEGSRMYKIKGTYYIWVTQPANGQWVLKSSSPFGPYTAKNVLLNTGSPTTIGGGVPHQGGLVDTPSGSWFYMAFVDSYPGGRIPAIAPVTFGSDGWPVIQFSSGNKWPTSLNYPVTKKLPDHPAGAFTDTFTSSALGPEWEWNHNPDTSKFAISSGLKLTTASVTNDLYQARNTLTHRILGPQSYATITLDYTNLKDGDRAGLAMLRDTSAYIAIVNNGGTYRVSMVNGLSMNTADWSTKSTGSEAAGATINSGTTTKKIYFRVAANIQPGANRPANFYYSTDGSTFSSLGPALSMNSDWQFFMGYRYAVFNYATKSAGGSVTLQKFDMQPGFAPANGTPATTTVVTKTSSATSAAPATSTTSGGGGGGSCSPLYAQCGGDSWAGAKCCSSGKCTFSNDFYSQCL